MGDDSISGRINAATGLAPVTDVHIRSVLANIAMAYNVPAATWVAGLDDDDIQALAWLMSLRGRTHCPHGVPYGVDCLQCHAPPF